MVLAREPEGYARLCPAMSEAQMAGQEGAPERRWGGWPGCKAGTGRCSPGVARGRWPRPWPTGDRRRPRPSWTGSWRRSGGTTSTSSCWDHGDPSTRSATTPWPARRRAGVEVVATNNVHYATPGGAGSPPRSPPSGPAAAWTSWTAGCPAAAAAHLRSGLEQAPSLRPVPGAVGRGGRARPRACAFDLALVAPRLPDFPVPPGHTEMTWLRELTERGAAALRPAARRADPGAGARSTTSWT